MKLLERSLAALSSHMVRLHPSCLLDMSGMDAVRHMLLRGVVRVLVLSGASLHTVHERLPLQCRPRTMPKKAEAAEGGTASGTVGASCCCLTGCR